MAHIGINGKGDNIFKRDGSTFNHYTRVHRWLYRHKGKPQKCENKDCEGLSTLLQWALIHGKKHEKNVDNYMCLCRKCHAKYDYDEEVWKNWHQREWTQEQRDKISKANKGRIVGEELKKKLSEKNSGSGNPMFGVHITGENHSWWGKKHSNKSKIKMLESSAKATKEQVAEIKKLVLSGAKQTDVARQFNLSKASISRIVNNKRYKLWG